MHNVGGGTLLDGGSLEAGCKKGVVVDVGGV